MPSGADAALTERLFVSVESHSAASVRTWEVIMLVASFGSRAGKGRAKIVANGALLALQFLLLLVEVDDLLIVDIEDFVGPNGTASVHVHVQLVRDQAAGDRELSFELAEETGQELLGVVDRAVLRAQYHRVN